MRWLKWVRLILASTVERYFSPHGHVLSQTLVPTADPTDYAQVFALAQIAQDIEGYSTWQLLQRHIEALRLVYVLIESCPNLLTSDIAEESFDTNGLFAFNDRHKVKLKEFDD